MPAKVYAYYPGCSGLGSSKEYEQSTRAVLKALGLEVQEIPDWSCCGSTPAHTVDHRLSSALAGRNLAQAERMGDMAGVITPCPSCLTNLKNAAHHLHEPAFRAEVNKLLDRPINTVLPVKSVLQAIYEDVGPAAIKARVVRPLSSLKLAPYYGCIMNRPPHIMQFDHHEHPVAMDELMEAIGANVVQFPLKVECCGASYGVARNDIVMKLSGKLLDTAADRGANAMVTACPLCQMNLDLRQGQINSANRTRHRTPVFYFTQLLGLALGMSEKEVGLDMLSVDPAPALTAPVAVPAEATA
ncbi:CoB--CoM heterodisulfide reductase iron-sulfur subunit B family protein [Megalodesulfovibrio gigas]|uniref:Putative CoB--CoM heterodisulfide reductase n=2 Tax=Megalodesulfovibrio gigas TaxID=879 RepID=T2G9R6_MEGG1|nr:CoB--CoM heterodisulfide reductase iron-sulfur subunit B family protein [Megalodesulfovibrio gigas]AGS82794.1 putative CoB--CoM heterodisulfide reductase [Megalodesulfovibrio gigas]AGW12924.1 putative CoB--CoM heterodisulfide reductase [Megalodesulfovibrio gigas DSM 1382 = ATCC 19364]